MSQSTYIRRRKCYYRNLKHILLRTVFAIDIKVHDLGDNNLIIFMYLSFNFLVVSVLAEDYMYKMY